MELFRPVRECYNYLKFPTRECREPKISNPLTHIHILVVSAFLFNILLLSIISTIINFEELPTAFDEFDAKLGKIGVFIAAVIVAPLFEEIIFRYPLKRKFSLITLMIFIDIGIIYIIIEGMGFHLAALVVPFALAIIALLIFAKSPDIQSEFDQRLPDMFPWIFYTVAGIFAFVHVFNYDTNSIQWYFTPILVMPQLFLGLVMGYLRLRIGLWSAIYFHALNNFIPALAIIYAL